VTSDPSRFDGAFRQPAAGLGTGVRRRRASRHRADRRGEGRLARRRPAPARRR